MSSFKDKIENYEVMPPAGAWDKITAALDDANQQDQFPARLRAMEINPPAAAWDKIAASLEPEQAEQEQQPGAVVINHPSRFSRVFRYVAAAVIIGAVAFGILQWTGSSYTSSTEPAVAKATPDSGNKKAGSNPDGIVAPAVNTPQNNNEAEQSPDKLIARLERPYRNNAKKTNNSVQTAVYSPGASKARAIYTYNDHVPSIADRYIMLMTPDGNLIRMSKKLGNLVCCVSGEDPDADCKDQLKKWQEKMATSSLTTSPGNFMDILNLVNSLDETSDL